MTRMRSDEPQSPVRRASFSPTNNSDTPGSRKSPQPDQDTSVLDEALESLVASSLQMQDGPVYTALELLGSGAHGAVWRCETENGTEVAVKLFTNTGDGEHFFRREAAVLAQVPPHRNIVPVRDVVDCTILGARRHISFPDDGTDTENIVGMIVMDFVPYDLFHILRARDNLEIQEVKYIIGAVASGLHALHDAGVAHRDIKLENILVSSSVINSETEIMICDFTLSSVNNMITSEKLGTAGYLSPETMAEVPHDPKGDDVWALGVLMYSLGTSFSPWETCSVEDSMYKVFSEDDISLFTTWTRHYSPTPIGEDFLSLFYKMCDTNHSTRARIESVVSHQFLRRYIVS